ncbi:MAG: ATP-binding protein [Alphaproteobacteria bacterium]|nr:ATP-binding protein [Alphaproteobacteria bacterium]
MFKLRSQQALLVIGFVVFLSGVYALAGYVLLRPLYSSIRFTTKEIQGVSDYKRLSEAYFRVNDERSAVGEAGENIGDLLREQLLEVGDESNLILDPELSSYYAANLLFNDVLQYADHLYGKAEGPRPQIDRLEHSIETICRSETDECVRLKELAENFKENYSKDAFLNQRTALLGDVQSIAKTTASILERLLEERLNEQVHQQRLMLGEIIGIYILLVLSIGYSSINFVRERELRLARESQKLAAQLAQKNDELEKFAHAAAHDLKEPVRTMRCYATLLKSESGNELQPSSTEYIDVIERAAHRAEQMINDLLNYAQVSEIPLALEKRDAAKEIRTALEDLKPVIDRLRPDITMSGLPTIWIVPSMFRRLITNLIDNSIKYRRLGSPPEIHIEAHKQNAYWVFSVRDNGMGIPKKDTASVFVPFKRLNPSARHEGQGIGLASCKKIVERLGGKIWIESDVETGTTVFFTIPAISEKENASSTGIREFLKKILPI